jgi:predicted RNA-binding protein (virulence factor B family)
MQYSGVTITATVEGKLDKVLASLPEGTIANNSDFGSYVNTGTAQEKYWLTKKDGDGDGVTFIKGGGNIYHYCYAGDALRVIALFDTPIVTKRGILCTNIRDFDLESFLHKAKRMGVKVNLHPAMT